MTEKIATPDQETSLVVLPVDTTPTELFIPDKIDPLLAEIERVVREHKPDISTEKGRKAIKSLAFKVARSKTTLDDMGKELVADWKEQAKKVDEVRASIRKRLDALKEEALAPLTAWEEKEEKRIQERENKIAHIKQTGISVAHMTIEGAEHSIGSLNAITTDEEWWQEFHLRAMDELKTAKQLVSDAIVRMKKDAEDKAELSRLRAEKEQREREEHDKKIAAEAADKARKEAEEKAAREAEEIKRKADADKKAQEDARIKAEEDARLSRERAEKAEEDARQAAIKAERDKKEAEERATEKERRRQEIEKQNAEAETKRREKDIEHRRTINNEALTDLMEMNQSLGKDEAQALIAAMARGSIRNVKIIY